MTTTIISSFLSNVNSNRSTDIYVGYGKKLLELNIPKIIFIEKDVYDTYLTMNTYENTHFVFIERSDINLYEHVDKITNFSIHSDNKTKDTIDYMITICSKTHWVKKGVELNIFNTEQFVWIDFGLYHMVKDESEFKIYIHNMMTKYYENIRISGIWDLNSIKYNNLEIDIYNRIMWYFSGCIFGGNPEKLVLFANLVNEKCIQIINEKKTLIWEVNVWFLVYKDHPELFDHYKSDHNILTIIYY